MQLLRNHRDCVFQQACNQHMRDTGHWQTVERYECACCYDTWQTEERRTEHEHQDHNYCAECNRTFQNFNNLTIQIKCLFCKNDFATAAELTHHLEARACSDAWDLNRDAIYRFVRGKDPCGLISKNLIGWTGSAEYEASNRVERRCLRVLPLPSRVPPAGRPQSRVSVL
ncbi:putative zinc finger protein [Hirsutella rhossiliensis]